MLKSLKIENFRGFKKFELNELGRINLLVGTNNSGKTSILEAIQLFGAKTNPLKPLGEIMYRRGEALWLKNDGFLASNPTFDLRHLFYGHEIHFNRQFSILGSNEESSENLTMKVCPRPISSEDDLTESSSPEIILVEQKTEDGKDYQLQTLDLIISWNNEDSIPVPIPSNYHLSSNLSTRFLNKSVKRKNIEICFIASSSLTIDRMTDLFNEIVLNPEEQLVYEALQIIEPKLERIATVGSHSDFRGGFLVRLSDSEQRIPIGSMGEGITRILGLTLALVSAKRGVLLVDDIDTGLHFSVMSDMWKLIWETAKKLDVQVFATTHNSDCWTSLASLTNQEDMTEDGITIHRIEPDKETSVVFTKSEIVIAAERGIEVR